MTGGSTLRHFVLAFILLLGAPAWAINPGEMFEDPAMEARAREIGRELRCLVCRNQSIFDSNAGLAQDLREVVRERMIAGDSDEEILSFVQSKFGDYVLLTPPVGSHTALLWATPAVLLILGGLGGLAYMRGRPRTLPEMEEETIA